MRSSLGGLSGYILERRMTAQTFFKIGLDVAEAVLHIHSSDNYITATQPGNILLVATRTTANVSDLGNVVRRRGRRLLPK